MKPFWMIVDFGPIGKKPSEIFIITETFSFKKMHVVCNMADICLDLNVFIKVLYIVGFKYKP